MLQLTESNRLPELTRKAWAWVDHDVYFEATWGFADFKNAFNRKFGELREPHKFYFISVELAKLLRCVDCMPISETFALPEPRVYLWRCPVTGDQQTWTKWDILRGLQIQLALEEQHDSK